MKNLIVLEFRTLYWNSGQKFKINKNQNLLTNEESWVKVNDRKWELIILAYKTLYGFPKFGRHNKFVAVHLHILCVLCPDLLHPGSVCLGFSCLTSSTNQVNTSYHFNSFTVNHNRSKNWLHYFHDSKTHETYCFHSKCMTNFVDNFRCF